MDYEPSFRTHLDAARGAQKKRTVARSGTPRDIFLVNILRKSRKSRVFGQFLKKITGKLLEPTGTGASKHETEGSGWENILGVRKRGTVWRKTWHFAARANLGPKNRRL